MECHGYWLLKSSCFEIFGDGKCGIFSPKKLMEMWYLLITEKILFWTFWRWQIRPFLSQRVNGKTIFSDYWKVHDLNFSEMGNTVFYGFSCSDSIQFIRSFSYRWTFLSVRNWYSMIEYFSPTRSMIILRPCQNLTHQNDNPKYVLQRRTLAIN